MIESETDVHHVWPWFACNWLTLVLLLLVKSSCVMIRLFTYIPFPRFPDPLPPSLASRALVSQFDSVCNGEAEEQRAKSNKLFHSRSKMFVCLRKRLADPCLHECCTSIIKSRSLRLFSETSKSWWWFSSLLWLLFHSSEPFKKKTGAMFGDNFAITGTAMSEHDWKRTHTRKTKAVHSAINVQARSQILPRFS